MWFGKSGDGQGVVCPFPSLLSRVHQSFPPGHFGARSSEPCGVWCTFVVLLSEGDRVTVSSPLEGEKGPSFHLKGFVRVLGDTP